MKEVELYLAIEEALNYVSLISEEELRPLVSLDRERRQKKRRLAGETVYLGDDQKIRRKDITDIKCRIIIKRIKETVGCCKCNERHIACLEFHHKEPEEKLFQVSAFRNHCSNITKLIREINKCLLICANCHKKEHYHGAF